MSYKDPIKQRECQAAWFQREKARLVKKNRENRKKRRDVVDEYKLSKGCSQCGYKKCAGVLEAHHRSNKEKSISRMTQNCGNIDRILDELTKCDILCANCHRELHFQKLRNFGQKNRAY